MISTGELYFWDKFDFQGLTNVDTHRGFVVGNLLMGLSLGYNGLPQRDQLWVEQYLIHLKYWPTYSTKISRRPSQYKDVVLPVYGSIPILTIRRSRDVLSLTWESPYLGKTVFILRRAPDPDIIWGVAISPDSIYLGAIQFG